MGQITDDEAFRHVADSYRWLACAECSIVDLRWGFTGPQRRTVDAMLPNVAIALGASAVVYGPSAHGVLLLPRSNAPE